MYCKGYTNGGVAGSHKMAFERLERSAVKVARSVLRRAAVGNGRRLSDSM